MVDKVVINSTTPPEDPAHVQAMVDKIDQANAGIPTDGANNTPTEDNKIEDRPQWLPEKFKSAEDLAKAYTELESKLGKPASQDAPKADGQATDQQAADELASKGLNLADFSNEFNEKGELSPESYDALEKAGYPRNIVDQYIDGQKARAALYESEIKSVAGGDQQFTEMVQWAAANMSPAEIAAYNAAIDSGDQAKAKLAVSGVYQRFQAARPAEPSLFKGATSASPSNEAYESIAQLQKDMANPDYKSDPAFRARVERKLANSNIL
jgi:hypothetical protein